MKGIMTKLAKDLISVLKAKNIPCKFEEAPDPSVDDQILIIGHPLDLHIQLAPYGYPYLYSVGMWTDINKNTMENYDCKSIAEVLTQVSARLSDKNKKRT